MAATVPVTRSSDTARSRLARNPLLVDTLVAPGLTAVSLVTIAGGARDFGAHRPARHSCWSCSRRCRSSCAASRPCPSSRSAIAALLGQALFAPGTFNSSIGGPGGAVHGRGALRSADARRRGARRARRRLDRRA